MILEGQGVGLHWVQGWALKNRHLVRIRTTLAVAPAKAHPFGDQHTLLLVVVGILTMHQQNPLIVRMCFP